jgi:hypothetical protein
VLDVSETAIEVCRNRLGENAEKIHWLTADVTLVELEPNAYDIWHDRAVFHFLTERSQRIAYVRNVARSVTRRARHRQHVRTGRSKEV